MHTARLIKTAHNPVAANDVVPPPCVRRQAPEATLFLPVPNGYIACTTVQAAKDYLKQNA
jgi:hypothetical protein